MSLRLFSVALAAVSSLFALPVFAIGTAFTYQGTLEDGGVPANGSYDLQFQLLDAANAPVGGALVADNVNVVKGVFTVQLDFGPSAFTGADRKLRIGVRPGPSGGAFTTLNPPTPITPAPYAQVSDLAEVAAGVVDNAISSTKIVDGSIGAVDVNPAQVQRRVTGTCLPGSSIRAIDAAGAVTCQPDSGGGGAFTLPYASTQADAGALFSLTNSGDGAGLAGANTSTSANAAAVRGTITATSPGGFSAGVRGENAGTGGLGIGVWGSQAGSGWGVYGVTPNGLGVYGNSSGAGTGVYANSTNGIGLTATSTNGAAATFSIFNNANASHVISASTVGTGSAARFENTNQTSIEANTLFVTSNSNGNIPDNSKGNVASFVNTNTNSVAAAVRGEVRTIFGNFGAAAIYGVSAGTGGFAGLFHASNPAGNGPGLVAINDGNGNAISANASKDGNAIEANIDGAGNALYAWVPSFAMGRAGRFQNYNEDNDSDAVTVTTVGNGIAVNAKVDNTQGTRAALKGEVNSIFANFGTAAVYGISSGTGGYAGLFHASNPAGNGPALIAIADGNGNGITANASNGGDGVETTADGTGAALYAWIPNFGTGRAGRFANFNTSNTNAVLTVEQHSNGSIALFKSGNPGTVNVARINSAGRGFFNGGTQVGGADLAEVVPLSGATPEPGDVVEIDPERPSHFRLASTPHSALVAGVISTEPGVLLNAKNADESLPDAGPALALAGRVPVKVTRENGAINPGDLLVASSTPGHAMRAAPHPPVGTVIGKALEAFDDDSGVIEMLVMLR